MGGQTSIITRNECLDGQTTQITMYERKEETSPTVGNLRLTNGQTTIGELTFTSSNDKMLIEEIFVKPSYRERGFGTRLLKMAEEFAAKHNLRQICLKPSPIDTVNLEALKDWYRRRGYTPSSFNLMKKPVSAKFT
ncbi:MAG: GNAT family N-acetyltransferase [Thaumarchaeota archaeon]|nr:GNAT family N-acetyltransferase [Nitrososphaerota archaeon]